MRKKNLYYDSFSSVFCCHINEVEVFTCVFCCCVNEAEVQSGLKIAERGTKLNFLIFCTVVTQ